MLASLTAYSSDSSFDGMPGWHFGVEMRELDQSVITATISLEAVALIATAHKQGALYELCRAIRDSHEDGYAALVGVEFVSD